MTRIGAELWQKKPRLGSQQALELYGVDQRRLPLGRTVDVTFRRTEPTPCHIQTVNQVDWTHLHNTPRFNQVNGPRCHFSSGESLRSHRARDHGCRRDYRDRCRIRVLVISGCQSNVFSDTYSVSDSEDPNISRFRGSRWWQIPR